MVDVKCCGMTRPGDALEAAALGARYVGVIFAGGQRHQGIPEARAILAPVRGRAQCVGVFGPVSVEDVLRDSTELELDVVQWHAWPSVADVAALRARSVARVWGVLRIGADGVVPEWEPLAAVVDGIVLDTRVDGVLGGSGVAFPWEAAREFRDRVRGRTEVILAGGLTPETVRAAMAILHPDVVDVSSGIESSVGIKDPARMRAFVEAVKRD